MRGHVAKKGSRYYAVVYEGFDAFTGKDKYRWHAAGDTRKAAEKLLGDLVKRLHDGDYRAPDRITFGDYLLGAGCRPRRRSCGSQRSARTETTSNCT